MSAPLPVAQSRPARQIRQGEFSGVVIAHAAASGPMMLTFGRLFAERLLAEGAELHFFASELPYFGGGVPPIAEYEAMGAQFHGLKLPRTFAPLAWLRCIVKMARELRRLRVEFLHTRGSIMGFVGRVAGRLAGVPHIIHHQDDLHFRDRSHSRMSRFFFAELESGLARLGHRSLFVSRVVLEDARQHGFDPKRCVLVGHDLHPVFQEALRNPPPVPPPRHRLLEQAGIPKGVKVIGCLGRLVQLKGIDTLIRAADIVRRTHPDGVFFIRGNGPLEDSLRAMIQEMGLAGRVVLCHDLIPFEELPQLYRSFDVFVLPTRREGFGMVFAEAMAMGVPVVGPRILPITEVVPENCGVLVEPENPQAYAVAIKALLESEDARRALTHAAVPYARYTWASQAATEQVIAVYRELLGRKPEIERSGRIQPYWDARGRNR